MKEGIPFPQKSPIIIRNLKSLYMGTNLTGSKQATCTVHTEREANGTLIISHLHYIHNQEQGGGFTVALDGLASTTGDERRRDFCSSASQELQRLFHSVAVTTVRTYTTAVKVSQALAGVKLPDSCYNCLLQTQSRQLSKRFFIYIRVTFCAQQKWCRN